MILVKCTHCDRIEDEVEHCILLTTELVRPIKTDQPRGDEGDAEWESPIWFNNTEKLLPNCPSKDMKLGLVPYAHGTTPVVIADKHGISGMWGQPLFLFFHIHDMQADLSNCVGKVYSVEVVGTEATAKQIL